MAKRRQCLHHGVACIIFLALIQSQFSSISSPQQHVRSLAQVPALSSHRILAFGTSRAWGSGLKDRHNAYPFLLSPNVSNLAIRATGCEYPSLCTMSMLESDTNYDVILIEYNHVSSNSEAKHFRRLALRLRHRFPNATIIFIYAWSPFEYTITTTMSASEHGGPAHIVTKNAHDVRRELFPTIHGIRSAPRLEAMWRAIAAASSPHSAPSDSSSAMSNWQRHANHKSRDWIRKTADAVQGHMWELPIHEDPTANLEINGKWFLPDCTHYSKAGHVAIQQGILQLLLSLQEREELLPSGGEPHKELVRDDVVGHWIGWDQCTSWFESGDLDSANSHISSNMTMREFANQKYALEAPGWITLQLERRSMLHINYMAGGPEQIYPTTRVVLKTGSGSHTVDVVPVVETNVMGKSAVHVVLTLPIGMVDAGVSQLEFIPLEEGQNPFRIVGTIASSDDDMGSNTQLIAYSADEHQRSS